MIFTRPLTSYVSLIPIIDFISTICTYKTFSELWGVVNNAGICYIGNIETIPQEDILRVLAVNFLGPVNVCKAFLPLLRQGKGRLVNIASNSGM